MLGGVRLARAEERLPLWRSRRTRRLRCLWRAGPRTDSVYIARLFAPRRGVVQNRMRFLARRARHHVFLAALHVPTRSYSARVLHCCCVYVPLPLARTWCLDEAAPVSYTHLRAHET